MKKMAQMLKILGIGTASGVAAVLIIAGMALFLLTPELKSFGRGAIFFGIILLIIYGILGAAGIFKRIVR